MEGSNKKDYFGFMHRMATDTRLSHASFRVLMVLASKANAQGWCWLPGATLARMVGMPERSVRLTLQRLIRGGYVRKVAVQELEPAALPIGLSNHSRIALQVQWQPVYLDAADGHTDLRSISPRITDPELTRNPAPVLPDPRSPSLIIKNKELKKELKQDSIDHSFSQAQDKERSYQIVGTILSEMKDLTKPARQEHRTTIPHIPHIDAKRVTLEMQRWSGYCSGLDATMFSLQDFSKLLTRAKHTQVPLSRNVHAFCSCLQRSTRDIVSWRDGLIVEVRDHSRRTMKEWLHG